MRRTPLMKIADIITTRRTIKSFTNQPIHENDLMSWLETASYAPNHRLNEPWEILILGTDTRTKLNHKTNFGQAPIVIAILSKAGATSFERDENVMAVSCFVQNFLLLTHEVGVGTYWASMGALAHNREILNVPQDADVIGIFGIGYPEVVPASKERTPIRSKITHFA